MKDGLPDEANRYDGAPAPSKPTPAMPGKEELHRNKQCESCGERKPSAQPAERLYPDCTARQAPREPFKTLCAECCVDREYDCYVEKRLSEGTYDLAVVYECGNVETYRFSRPMVDGPGDGEKIPHPHAAPSAEVNGRCPCGSEIMETVLGEE